MEGTICPLWLKYGQQIHRNLGGQFLAHPAHASATSLSPRTFFAFQKLFLFMVSNLLRGMCCVVGVIGPHGQQKVCKLLHDFKQFRLLPTPTTFKQAGGITTTVVTNDRGRIFLRRFRLYVLSFMF